MGENNIFPELCAPLCLWGGIHPVPVSANPPPEVLYPQGGPHLFPPPSLLSLEKIISLPLPVVTQNCWHFKCFFSWWFEFCASGVPGWEIDHGFYTTDPLCYKTWYRLVMRGLGCGEGGLYVQDMWRPPPTPPTLSTSPSLSLGMILSAHTSTLQHRCCCIVWSSKARISPTGSFYSLAIVSVCLTRPLMNAAVSRRSDTRQRTEKEPPIHLQDTFQNRIPHYVQHV